MIADDSNTPPGAGSPAAPRNSARRLLLRGSFAAPTVLTLSSGSALAASSSLRCFNNSPAGADQTDTNVFRVQRYKVTIGQTTTRLVKAADINSVATINGFSATLYTSGKTWINVSDGSNYIPNGNGNAPAMDTGQFVALRFENAGTETAPNLRVSGLATDSTVYTGNGKVLSGSCWSSFK